MLPACARSRNRFNASPCCRSLVTNRIRLGQLEQATSLVVTPVRWKDSGTCEQAPTCQAGHSRRTTMIAIERVSWKDAERGLSVARAPIRASESRRKDHATMVLAQQRHLTPGPARPGIRCMVDAIIRQVALPSCCRGTGKPSASQLRPDIHTCQRSVRLRCRSDEYCSSVQHDHSSGEWETLIGWLKRRPRLPAS